MTLENLTPEQKKALLKELEAEQRAERLRKEQEIENFKTMQDSLVADILPGLAAFGNTQKEIVKKTMQNFAALVELKSELYGTKDGGQYSHTFTARDGSGSVTIGANTIIAFDGTESAGVEMIKQFILNISAGDEKRAQLADLLNTYLKPDKNGNLNPTRIVELSNKAAQINDPLLTKGIDTIVKAQFKTSSTSYVRGWMLIKGENGEADTKFQFNISA